MNLSNKQMVVKELLADYAIVRLFVVGPLCVGIPESKWHSPDGLVPLDVGYNLPRPIRDMVIDGSGFSGLFIFDGNSSPVHVPWGALAAALVHDMFSVSWPVDHQDAAGLNACLEEDEPKPSGPKLELVK